VSFFTDKTAIITGAGCGIGKGLSEQLIKQGARVVLADNRQERLDEIIRDVGTLKGRVKAVCLDVTDFERVQSLVRETAAQLGRLDYMFNNAGIAVGGEVRDCAIDDWRAVLDVNLMGVINGVVAAYPIMVSQGFGHIVNTGSIEGLLPFPGSVSYVASKFGVVGLSRALRIEGRDLGVKVSVVCPGYIETRIFLDAKLTKLDREKLLEKLPDKHAMMPEECALKILKGVKKNKEVIIVTAAAKAGWWLQRFLPKVIEWIMYRGISVYRDELRVDN